MANVQRFGILTQKMLGTNDEGVKSYSITLAGAGFEIAGVAPAEHAKAFEQIDAAAIGDRLWFWGPRIDPKDAGGEAYVIAHRAKITGLAAEYAPQDLTALKGVGPKMAEKMAAAGVKRYRDLARMTDEALAALDIAVSQVRGALLRADVRAQAAALIQPTA